MESVVCRWGPGPGRVACVDTIGIVTRPIIAVALRLGLGDWTDVDRVASVAAAWVAVIGRRAVIGLSWVLVGTAGSGCTPAQISGSRKENGPRSVARAVGLKLLAMTYSHMA